MMVSKKVLEKLFLIIVIINLLCGIVCLYLVRKSNENNYYYYLNEDNIEEMMSKDFLEFRCMTRDILYGNNNEKIKAEKYFLKLSKNGYDINGNGEVEQEEFVQIETNNYKSYANSFYQKNKAINVIIFILIIIIICVSISVFKYFVVTNRLIKRIQNYSNYMLATEKYNITDISREFGESIDIVEKDIQTAIDKHILRNVYLSKQNKEIIPINKSKKSIKNFQEVNLENNLIIQKRDEDNK